MKNRLGIQINIKRGEKIENQRIVPLESTYSRKITILKTISLFFGVLFSRAVCNGVRMVSVMNIYLSSLYGSKSLPIASEVLNELNEFI